MSVNCNIDYNCMDFRNTLCQDFTNTFFSSYYITGVVLPFHMLDGDILDDNKEEQLYNY